MTATTSIKAATASDQEQVVAVILLAFSADPVARWSYPDPHDYLEHFPHLVRALGGQAFAHGSAHCVEGFSGAALWLPPGVMPDEEAITAVLRRTIPERRQEEVFSVLEQMGGYHPSEPHWYLPLIGVDPSRHSQGYGSALMQHALLQCDRERIPAYLESTNSRNIHLYERHGFKSLGKIQAGESPPIVPMLRKPEASTANEHA